jgi:hypothetical protein
MDGAKPAKYKPRIAGRLVVWGIGAALLLVVGMVAFKVYWTSRDVPSGPEYRQAGVSAGDGLAYDRLRRQGYSPQEAAKRAPGFRKACEDYPSTEQCAYGRP